MTPADVLDGAADYIEKVGWTRGLYVRDGRVCAWGAIERVEPSWRIKKRVAVALMTDIGEPVPMWNDRQTSAEAVIRQLRATAARLREGK